MPGLTCDRKVVRNDIKLAAKIITNLDNKWGLWQQEKKDDVIGKMFSGFYTLFFSIPVLVPVGLSNHFLIMRINNYICIRLLDINP